MTIQEQVKKEKIQAMKDKDVPLRTFLSVVSGELQRAEMNEKRELNGPLTDQEAIVVIKKMSKDAAELNNDFEVKALEGYLPAMLETKQIEVIVAGIISTNGYSGMQDMGKVMGEIKKLPSASQIDGKIASGIVKQLLIKT